MIIKSNATTIEEFRADVVQLLRNMAKSEYSRFMRSRLARDRNDAQAQEFALCRAAAEIENLEIGS